MGTVDDSKDVEMFEEMFKDRFTEKDEAYMAIKAKPLSHPAVVYPWRVKKMWNKSWDHTRQDHERRDRYNDRNHHRSNSNYRDRSSDNYRDRSNDRYRDRSNDGESSRYEGRNSGNRNAYRSREDRR